MLDDFDGLEGCNEILNDTRPDVVAGIHHAYFAVGADAVETNTFGANLPNLAEYDIADRIQELAEKGARIAREVADEVATADRPRFVLGSVGPGTKLPTLGHESYVAAARRLRRVRPRPASPAASTRSSSRPARTCCRSRRPSLGARRAMVAEGRRIPIVAHVTVETTGTMLLGSEIGAALTAIEPLGVDLIGLNCATGPAEMSEHLRTLSKHARIPLSVMPNAGLPVLGTRRRGVPADARRARRGARRLRARLRRCGSSAAAAARPRSTSAPVVEAVAGVTPATRTRGPSRGVSSLYARGAVPPGRLGARWWASGPTPTAARPSARRCSRSDWDDCVAIGARADPRRRAPDRPLRRLRRPRRRRGHARARRPARHRVHAADHARLHRAGRAARRAGAPGRPVDRQLRELRGRRRARLALPADAWRSSASTAPRSWPCASTRRARPAPPTGRSGSPTGSSAT